MKLSRTLLFILLLGCGYKIYQPIQYRLVSIPIFENSSDRRANEFELTNLVIKELQLRGVKISETAPHILRCEITNISEPILVMGSKDVLLVGSYSIKLKVQLIERSSQKPIATEEIYYQAPFSTLQGKTLESARQEAMTNVAHTITTKLESKW